MMNESYSVEDSSSPMRDVKTRGTKPRTIRKDILDFNWKDTMGHGDCEYSQKNQYPLTQKGGR
jgi:hypothetical protein